MIKYLMLVTLFLCFSLLGPTAPITTVSLRTNNKGKSEINFSSTNNKNQKIKLYINNNGKVDCKTSYECDEKHINRFLEKMNDVRYKHKQQVPKTLSSLWKWAFGKTRREELIMVIQNNYNGDATYQSQHRIYDDKGNFKIKEDDEAKVFTNDVLALYITYLTTM